MRTHACPATTRRRSTPARAVTRALASLATVPVLVGACGGAQRAGGVIDRGRIVRADFNRLAARAGLPVYWRADANADGAVDPDEVTGLLFYGGPQPTWTEGGRFTAAFDAAYEALVVAARAPTPAAPREAKVWADLDAALPTLVETDLDALPADHAAFALAMVDVAAAIDTLYERQLGVDALAAQAVGLDAASASLLRRNRGPRCASVALQRDPACSALPGAPKPVLGVYPAALQAQAGFCDKLDEALQGPFTAVVEREGGLVAVPFHEAFAAPTQAAAAALERAVAVLQDPKEDALRTYLRAAAAAFRTDDWFAADEAWAAMNAHNSRWYVRVGPDETYWEPCSRKAGFHLTLALINPGSLAWQAKLAPLQQDLERGLAALAGPPYRERNVEFQLPDFIDIVLNAGDDRTALGATVGQSLPNVGPVAEESRGRTVVMANLYTDPDSRAAQAARDASLFDGPSLALLPADGAEALLDTIAHEACHNFGPSYDYRPVADGGATGPTANEAFGGGLASMLEELKAQTCGLWVVGQLRARGVIDEPTARATYASSMSWALGQAGQGMVDADGNRNTYPQLAAIQLAYLRDRGVVTFDAEALAANGADRGAFSIDLAAMPAAIEALTRQVAGIKARADRAAADALAEPYLGPKAIPLALVQARGERAPRASFVYALRGGPQVGAP